MTNGANTWGVSFSLISWFKQFLESHGNVEQMRRHHDVIFEIRRKSQQDSLTIFCCHEYTMGLTLVHRATHEFGKLDLICIGGGWCGYTRQAKQYCLDAKIGLYVADETYHALWTNEFWAYHDNDKDGNPIYRFRSA